MNKYIEYYNNLSQIERQIVEQEASGIEAVAACMARTLKAGKNIYLFGCGHSHILVEEAFYRAGGLVPVNPIFDSAIMLHEGAVKSSHLERLESYGDWIFDRQSITQGDMIFIFSNSGINGCPVQVALRAKQAGATVVAVSAKAYDKTEKSRHSSGKRLSNYADYVLDTHIPHGDALLQYGEQRIAPGSTIACALIWNMLIAQLAEESEKIGYQPEYFVSGNVEGGFQINEQYIDKYKYIVRNL